MLIGSSFPLLICSIPVRAGLSAAADAVKASGAGSTAPISIRHSIPNTGRSPGLPDPRMGNNGGTRYIGGFSHERENRNVR